MCLNLLFACGQVLEPEMFLTILFSFIITFVERIYQPLPSHLSCKMYSLFSSLLFHYTCPYQPFYSLVFVFLVFSSLSVFIFLFVFFFYCIPLESLEWREQHHLWILYLNCNNVKCILRQKGMYKMLIIIIKRCETVDKFFLILLLLLYYYSL